MPTGASTGAVERRFAAAELRAAGRRLEGHAAVFGVDAAIADFVERVAPGAFSATLAAGGDVVALVDHDPGRLLGRTRNGTLRLSEDSRGLAFSVDLADTSLANDLLAMAERGDLGGASFGFRVPRGGDRWEGRTRTLVRVDLVDVSAVIAWPAYPQTDVAARTRPERRLPLALARRRLELARVAVHPKG